MTASSNEATLTLPAYARWFLAVLAAVNLGIGLVFYLIPPIAISSWGWPIKELAARFLGAIFLAIALGCRSALQARLWQRAKILVLVGGAFLTVTGVVSIFQATTVRSGIIIWSWATYFVAAGIGCLILIKNQGWRRLRPETSGQPLKLSKLFFAIQTSAVGVFGAMMVLTPSLAQDQFWPWKVATPTLQTFGALFLATCLATGWAFFQKSPMRIVVLLPLDAIFPSLALLAVGIGWSTIVSESPSWLVTAVWLFLYSFVAVGSTSLYFILRRRSMEQH